MVVEKMNNASILFPPESFYFFSPEDSHEKNGFIPWLQNVWKFYIPARQFL